MTKQKGKNFEKKTFFLTFLKPSTWLVWLKHILNTILFTPSPTSWPLRVFSVLKPGLSHDSCRKVPGKHRSWTFNPMFSFVTVCNEHRGVLFCIALLKVFKSNVLFTLMRMWRSLFIGDKFIACLLYCSGPCELGWNHFLQIKCAWVLAVCSVVFATVVSFSW